MAQSKFDRELEEALETLAVGAGSWPGGIWTAAARTDAMFFRPDRRVLPKVDGRVPRCSYRPGWQRLGDGAWSSSWNRPGWRR